MRLFAQVGASAPGPVSSQQTQDPELVALSSAAEQGSGNWQAAVPAPDSVDGKAFATLRAQLGLAGWTLEAAEEAGSTTFFANRWGRSRTLPDLDAVGAFVRQVGVKS